MPISDDTDPTRDAADRAQRTMSMSQAAIMLGCNRSTLRDWVNKKGCPVAEEGGVGDARRVDLKAVRHWRENQIREEERARLSSADASDPSGKPMTVKERIDLEKLKGQVIKNARDAEFLVPRPVAEAAFERCLGLIRISVMAIPERLVREMAGFPEDRKLAWREKAMKACRSALAEGAKAIQTALPEFEPPTE